ncbi:MAG TPA: hypothetical protein VFT87_01425 [Candidatus Saccharimonadales bacterium]|nr:hypothetical protein [Candidatus Saccharimonadales bacterium]
MVALIRKIRKWVDTINTYYAFALLLYGLILFIARHSNIFLAFLLVTLPPLTGWTGYLLRSYFDRRNQRHGFTMVSDGMSYEIRKNHKYILRYTTKLRAAGDHLMTYPVGYQWTGAGRQGAPHVFSKHQHIMKVVHKSKNGVEKIAPYKLANAADGDWQYSFVAFNPPVHNGELVQIDYEQEFYDKQHRAKPILYYFVRTPMKRLELSVKFPASGLPKAVTGSYIKPSDSRRPYLKRGVRFNKNQRWASWVISKPKRGYCYRITWQ